MKGNERIQEITQALDALMDARGIAKAAMGLDIAQKLSALAAYIAELEAHKPEPQPAEDDGDYEIIDGKRYKYGGEG